MYIPTGICIMRMGNTTGWLCDDCIWHCEFCCGWISGDCFKNYRKKQIAGMFFHCTCSTYVLDASVDGCSKRFYCVLFHGGHMGFSGWHLACHYQLYVSHTLFMQLNYYIFSLLKSFHMSEAFYGILFVGNEEAAFSNFRLFEASGSVITYMLSPMFCTHTKLIILIVLMSVGITGYLFI